MLIASLLTVKTSTNEEGQEDQEQPWRNHQLRIRYSSRWMRPKLYERQERGLSQQHDQCYQAVHRIRKTTPGARRSSFGVFGGGGFIRLKPVQKSRTNMKSIDDRHRSSSRKSSILQAAQ